MANFINLALVGAGFTTISGMVYGGYELLKNEPKPIAELLQIKKRIPLNKDNDLDAWKVSWSKYIEANTKTVEEEDTSFVETKKTKKVVVASDPWGLLNNWTEIQKKREEVPQELKNKCEGEKSGKENGIWTSGYKNFEKYCTKEDNSED